MHLANRGMPYYAMGFEVLMPHCGEGLSGHNAADRNQGLAGQGLPRSDWVPLTRVTHRLKHATACSRLRLRGPSPATRQPEVQIPHTLTFTLTPHFMNQGWTYRDRVPTTAAGQSLLDYYTQRYRHSSCEEWRHRIEQEQITVDGSPAQAGQLLQTNQQLAYHRAPWQEPAVPLDFEVLYKDDDLLAIAKPSGLPVLPGGQFLENTLLHQLKRRYPQASPSPVHRLGRGTSGVMLLARSPLAKVDLSRQLRHSSQMQNPAASFQKIYRALIGPGNLPDTFEITTPIGPVPYPVLGTIYAATPAGKRAYSQGHVMQRSATQTLLAITILTGRPHQIRIHLAAIGYPLLGDPLYAPGGHPKAVVAAAKLPVPSDLGYCLHAERLQFIHPRTRTLMSISCPPPPSLQLSTARDRIAGQHKA